MNDHDLTHQHAPDDDERDASAVLLSLEAKLNPPVPAFPEPGNVAHAIALDAQDAAALVALIDAHCDDLGIVDGMADYGDELAHVLELRRRIAALHDSPARKVPRLTSVHIGNVDGHYDKDVYYLVSVHRDDDPPTEAMVTAWFLASVYEEGRGPGQRFCHRVTVTEQAHSEGMRWLCIAHIEWDV